MTDDHDREFSVADLSVQIFTVPSLVSTERLENALVFHFPGGKTCVLLNKLVLRVGGSQVSDITQHTPRIFECQSNNGGELDFLAVLD